MKDKMIVPRLSKKNYRPVYRFRNPHNVKSIEGFQEFISHKKKERLVKTCDPIAPEARDLKVCEVDRYGFQLDFVINECSGILRAERYYDEDMLGEFYKHYYRDIYTLGRYSYNRLLSDQIILGEKILNLVQTFGFQPTSVLDFGTGVGGALLPFKSTGVKTLGVDLNASSVEWGGKTTGVDLKCAGIDELVRSGEKFDLIILNHVLEHIIDPNTFLTKLRSILSDNGHAYISVPSLEVIPKWYEWDLGYYLQNAHVWNFSVRSFSRLMAHNNYKILFSNSNVDALICKSSDVEMGSNNNEISCHEINLLKDLEKVIALQKKEDSHLWNRFIEFLKEMLSILKFSKCSKLKNEIKKRVGSV